MPTPSGRRRTVVLMVLLWVTYPLLVLISWGMLAEAGWSTARTVALAVLEPVFGAVAIALLPLVLFREATPPDWTPDARREARALPLGLLVIACSGFSVAAVAPAFIALGSLAGRRRARWLLASLAAFAVALLVGELLQPLDDPEIPFWWVVLTALLITTIPVLYGLYRGSRRELLRSLRQEADAARRGQDAVQARARQAERTRIAREMHDTVSHRLALAVLHAGALEYRDDLSPEQVREAAAVIRQGLQEASDELAGVLRVLREDGGDVTPAPTVEDLEALVEQVRAAGAPVQLTTSLPDEQLPAGAAAHLFRVVQESLTNAVKHAPGCPVRVDVSGAPEAGVQVEVSNPLPAEAVAAPGSRVGLVGLTERLTLADGHFDAGVREGRFVVKAWVPWPI